MWLTYSISKFSFQLSIYCRCNFVETNNVLSRHAHKQKPFRAIAYAGIYNWNEDQSQAQKVSFTEADVTLYPDNQNPGQ